jgi:hypothetical protein
MLNPVFWIASAFVIGKEVLIVGVVLQRIAKIVDDVNGTVRVFSGYCIELQTIAVAKKKSTRCMLQTVLFVSGSHLQEGFYTVFYQKIFHFDIETSIRLPYRYYLS